MRRTTTTGPIVNWVAETDSYGRRGHGAFNADFRCVGKVVKLPFTKVGEPRAYLVNDWTDLTAGAVTYHPTLKSAKAHLAAVTMPRRWTRHGDGSWTINEAVSS